MKNFSNFPDVVLRKVVNTLTILEILHLALTSSRMKNYVMEVMKSSVFSAELTLKIGAPRPVMYIGGIRERKGHMTFEMRFKGRNAMISWDGEIDQNQNRQVIKFEELAHRETETIKIRCFIFDVLSETIEIFKPKMKIALFQLTKKMEYSEEFADFLRKHETLFSSAERFVGEQSRWLCKSMMSKGKNVVYVENGFTTKRLMNILTLWKTGGLTNLQKMVVHRKTNFPKDKICELVGAIPFDPAQRDKLFITGTFPEIREQSIRGSFDFKQDGTEKIASLQFFDETVHVHVWECAFPVRRLIEKLKKRIENLEDIINRNTRGSHFLMKSVELLVAQLEKVQNLEENEKFKTMKDTEQFLIKNIIEKKRIEKRIEELEKKNQGTN